MSKSKLKYFTTILYGFKTKKEKETFIQECIEFDKMAGMSDFNLFDKKDKFQEALERIVEQGTEDNYDDNREELEKQLLDLPEDSEEYKFIMEVLDEMPVWMEPIDIAYHALNEK